MSSFFCVDDMIVMVISIVSDVMILVVQMPFVMHRLMCLMFGLDQMVPVVQLAGYRRRLLVNLGVVMYMRRCMMRRWLILRLMVRVFMVDNGLMVQSLIVIEIEIVVVVSLVSTVMHIVIIVMSPRLEFIMPEILLICNRLMMSVCMVLRCIKMMSFFCGDRV